MQLTLKDDKLKKYQDHLIHGTDISTKEKEIFDRYFFAFSQLLDGLSERKVVELLMVCPAPIGGISQSMAYNVVNGCQQIFGGLDIANSKKQAKRYIYSTRLEEMAQTVKELADMMMESGMITEINEHGQPESRVDPDVQAQAGILYDKSANILMKAAKVGALLDKDKFENPNKYKVAPNIIFTDDMSALEMIREIEDTEFENVTGNGGETEEGTPEAAGTEG